MDKDYYSILGVDKKATDDEIKKAFRKLSLQYHPDRLAGKTEEEKKQAQIKFQEISEAYNVLSDNQKRQEYDMQSQGFFGGGFDPFSAGGFDVNPFDIFGGGVKQRVVKGEDIKVDVTLTLEEAFNGGDKEIKYTAYTQCTHCNGTGSEDGQKHTCPHCNGRGVIQSVKTLGNTRMMQTTTCPYCGGTGEMVSTPCSKCGGKGLQDETRTTIITIPNGIFDGATLQIKGLGNAPKSSGINGDMFVVVHIQEHDQFEADGSDLYMDLHISLYDSLLGRDAEVKTIDGGILKLKIKELTVNHSLLRARGKGMYQTNTSNRGDLYIRIIVDMPKFLTTEQKKLLKKFNDIELKKS